MESNHQDGNPMGKIFFLIVSVKGKTDQMTCVQTQPVKNAIRPGGNLLRCNVVRVQCLFLQRGIQGFAHDR